MLWFDQPRDSQPTPTRLRWLNQASLPRDPWRSLLYDPPWWDPHPRRIPGSPKRTPESMKLAWSPFQRSNQNYFWINMSWSTNPSYCPPWCTLATIAMQEYPTCWFIRRSKSESCHGWFSTFDTSLAWQVAVKTCEKTFKTWNVSCQTYWLMVYKDTSPRLQCLIYAKAPMAIVQLRTWNTQVDQKAILRCPVLRCEFHGAESFPTRKMMFSSVEPSFFGQGFSSP